MTTIMLRCTASLMLLGLVACSSPALTPYQQQLNSEQAASYHAKDSGRLLRCLYERRAERADRYRQSAAALALGSAIMTGLSERASAHPNGIMYQSDVALLQQCQQAFSSGELNTP
ncbi:hypothetical protein [Zymobacter palmae]|uniref:Acyl-CoA synthetases n=1 Tax=Zymobacter palmae TaxID=33074 RepID=A0A348HEJ6_9GAMM|nr:hypothetical protein [Zymobacter palmae]BBG30048.1 acyl-CoA synthetases [Zymobacter palmae]